MSTRDVVLQTQQLSYAYKGRSQPALDAVNLQLSRGQAVGLLGPNGSGKSTLIQLLVGLREPQSGEVIHAQEKRSIAWVPQEYAFYPELTCLENLRFFVGMIDVPRVERLQRVESAIQVSMLQDFAHRRARECSGGVRRRLNLAIALLQRPTVLLLDEPTVGVDPQSRAFLLDRICDMVQGGTAVLYATHYMEEVSAVCSHILLLDQGHVVASGNLATLLRGDERSGPFPDLEALFMHHTQRRLRD